MTPYDRCRELFNARYPDAHWNDYVDYYMRCGVVHSTPDYFVMARKVNHKGSAVAMRGEWFDSAECDCWFFAWFSGDMEKVWEVNEPLEYVAWERLHDGELTLQIARMAALKRLTTAHG